MTIPHSRPTLDAADRLALEQAMGSGYIASGTRARQFEQDVARRLGVSGARATSSGTAALFAALQALGLHSGDEVIVPTYVCGSVWQAVTAAGATPVLCDVGADWCMSAESVCARVTPRTKAVVVVHTFGIAAPVQAIAALGVPVIEDCAHAFGLAIGGRQAGAFGAAAILSFEATKLLTTGEGGMVVSNDDAIMARVRRALGDGLPPSEGLRQPMSDLQAAIGLSQLARYDGFLARRRALADRYFDALAALPVDLPQHIRSRSIFFRFPLSVDGDFDTLRARFLEQGVHVRRGVDAMLHQNIATERAAFPGAERCWRTTVSLPLYPSMSESECEQVIDACQKVFGRG